MAAEVNDDVILAYRPSQIKALMRASWWKGCWSGFSLGIWSAIGGGACGILLGRYVPWPF